VIQHELAHSVNKFFWGGRRPTGAGGPHNLEDCYNPGKALSEGFANYVAYAVQFPFDSWHPIASYLNYDIEDLSSAGYCMGPSNEAWVSAAFWDLYDYWNDGPSADRVDTRYYLSHGFPISVYLRNPRDSMMEYLPIFQTGQPADVQGWLRSSFRLNTMIP
jgi:hypothetical protein